MNPIIEAFNRWGGDFLSFAWPMLWQSSLLIAILFALERLSRRWIRASIRYALWLVVLVKLCVPPTLALPTSPAWWVRSVQLIPAVKSPAWNYTVTYDNDLTPVISPEPWSVSAPPKATLKEQAWLLVMATMFSAALLCWLLVRWWQVTRLVRRAVDSERLTALANEMRQAVGMRFRVRVKVTANSMSPAVCGLFRPAILMPQALAEDFSEEQLRAVLLHELIHLQRGDVWLNFLQALVQIGYWWHPLVWAANARIRRVREEAVDDAVMLALRDGAEAYAPTLLEVAKLALNRPLASLGLVGILESRRSLRQRIERLVDFRPPRRAGLTLASLVGILAFTAVAVPMGQGPEQVEETAKAPMVKHKVPWPDPNFEGIRTVGMTAHFLIIDESQIQAAGPALTKLVQPVSLSAILSAEEADTLLTQLLQAKARFFNGIDYGISQPAISGAPQYYRIGGGTNQTGRVTFLTTNAGGSYSNMLAGVDIEMPATQPDWEPMNLTLRALMQDAGTHCELNLSFPRTETGAQHSEQLIPHGGAFLWITSPPGATGKYQVVLLLPWDAEKYYKTTFQTRTYRVSEETLYSAWTKGGEIIMTDTSPLVVVDWLMNNAGINFLPPRTMEYTNGVLSIRASEKDLDRIGQILKGIGGEAGQGQYPSSENQPETKLYTRTFSVDARTLISRLRWWDVQGLDKNELNKSPEAISDAVSAGARKYFTSLGVDLESPPGKSVFFNDRNNTLYVKATLADMGIIEKGIQTLLAWKPQVHIKARFVEVPAEELAEFHMLTNNISDGMMEILTSGQAKTAWHRLEAGKIDILAEPEIVTASGRQTQFRATRTINVVTGVKFKDEFEDEGYDGSNSITFVTEPVETGPILDLVPTVLADGYTIDLKATPSLTDFMGYDQLPSNAGIKQTETNYFARPVIRPSFHIQESNAHLKLWDNQAVVLGRFKSSYVPVNTNGVDLAKMPAKSKTNDRELMVFITATLVDAAGNRIHSEEDMPFAKDEVPPQN